MKSNSIVLRFALLVLGVFFLVNGMVLAEVFLVPLVFGVMLTLVCIPLARKFEKKGVSRGLASFASVVLCILVYVAFFAVIAIQVGSVSERWPEIEEKLSPRLNEAVEMIEGKTGLNVREQMPQWLDSPSGNASEEDQAQAEQENETSDEEALSELQAEGKFENGQSQSPKTGSQAISDGVKKQLGQVAVNLFGFLGNSFLTFVYLFFLLNYRNKVKLSILRFFSGEKRKRVKEVLEESVQLALNFLGGRFLLIFFLAVIYTAGMLIAGVENAILISVIAAILSLIPYLGVIIGYVLAIVMALVGGAETWSLIVVSVTYGAAQFIESYILEPFVVGDKVNLNPLSTIIVVVLGSAVWGVAGMILSIPLAGICKIVFDSVDKLEPLGYMLGEEDVGDEDQEGFLSRWGEKLRGKLGKN
ncbi:AI-2E family transporter [Algoriphagus sp. H41]|uniref:AI-2E family transporter n=1 Tax=Algoriphagus oliviformis TaxID=2811231 RepID=A0ABS3C1P7_9BACT|nr:AI-2E family transporter [Algoriphagus oliviformis]MBN7811040.1 AI-2E family transporter [Algoriphagus oliviformis]